MRWGIVTTLSAPEDQVLAFVAHHLQLGADRIWLCFDDPCDPAVDRVARHPQVTALRCDARHWDGLGISRPERHQNRQTANAQAVLRGCGLDWLAHIDVDEFLTADAPLRQILSAVPRARPFVRAKAWEALYSPGLADDIFTATAFRAPLNAESQAPHRAAIFGPFAPLLPTGCMSHAVGKCFFRPDVPGLQAWLHGASKGGEKLPPGPPLPGVALLHFHSQDPVTWKGRLPFRLERGAYVLKPELALFLKTAETAEIDAFYRRCLTATPEALAYLHKHRLVRETTLSLRAKVAALGL